MNKTIPQPATVRDLPKRAAVIEFRPKLQLAKQVWAERKAA